MPTTLLIYALHNHQIFRDLKTESLIMTFDFIGELMKF